MILRIKRKISNPNIKIPYLHSKFLVWKRRVRAWGYLSIISLFPPSHSTRWIPTKKISVRAHTDTHTHGHTTRNSRDLWMSFRSKHLFKRKNTHPCWISPPHRQIVWPGQRQPEGTCRNHRVLPQPIHFRRQMIPLTLGDHRLSFPFEGCTFALDRHRNPRNLSFSSQP